MLIAQAAPSPRGFNPGDPALKFDLVIANADVLDPGSRVRGRRDLGIKNGQIAAVSSSAVTGITTASKFRRFTPHAIHVGAG